MKIAVTGAEGQLGREICRQLGPEAVPLTEVSLDITKPSLVQRVVTDLHADAFINCAAYTNVDHAEQEPDRCAAVNAEAVASLAAACRGTDCPLVQLSTDYVFGADDSRSTPYRETDEPGPQGVYACTKLDGETHAAGWEKHFIVRTCGLYARSASNFVETMLRLGRERDHLRVVDDQHCTPSYVVHVARAALFLLRTEAYGTYHVVNAGATSWYEFALEIFRQSGIDVAVQPITTDEFAAVAPRPHYSVLDTAKYRSLGGPVMPTWREALAEYLAAREGPEQ